MDIYDYIYYEYFMWIKYSCYCLNVYKEKDIKWHFECQDQYFAYSVYLLWIFNIDIDIDEYA